MPDDIRILTLADRDCWIAEHAEDGLPSQSWRYASALAASGITPKLAIVRSGGARMLLPFFERDWGGHTDIATVLGLSGASLKPPSVAPLALWREYASAQGWVAGYIQVSPYSDLAGKLPEGCLSSHNDVFLLNLRDTNLLARMSRTIRRKIRDAGDAGVTLERDPRVIAAEMSRLYPTTMQRLGAGSRYSFAPGTMAGWVLDPTALALGALRDGVIRAVYLFQIARSVAESHMFAYEEDSRDLAAWLIWHGIAALRERGVETLNLGGGIRRGDGIWQFKTRFNGITAPLCAARQVYDRARYAELCRAAGTAPDGPWFPAYRAPGAAPSGPAA